MKQVIAALLLGLISFPALADMWILSGSTVSGSSFVCTYSSPDGRFQTTIVTSSSCAPYINR